MAVGEEVTSAHWRRASGSDSGRRFGLGLAVITALALGLRLLYGFLVVDDPVGDSFWYHAVANGIADGDGFRNPFQGWKTAFHPPLFPAALAVVSLFGGTTMDAHQVAGCFLAATGVAGIGLLGRQLAGDGAGLFAAGLAALLPSRIAYDSIGMSESLVLPLIAAVLLLALRLRDRPTSARAFALGAVVGLAALTRTEAMLLGVLLVAPLAYALPAARLRLFVVALLGLALVVGPWVVRNSLTWERPVGIVTGDGTVLAGANCATTYGGPRVGQWDPGCLRPPWRTPNEPAASARWRRIGIEYARDHAISVPRVVVIRVLRTWDLFDPRVQVNTERELAGAPLGFRWLSVLAPLVTLCLAAAGAVLMRRRGAPVLLLIAPVLMVTLVSAVGYGQPRFRAAADVPLLALAGATLSEGARRLTARRRPSDAGSGSAA